jgi:Lysyl oxidase
MPRLRLLLCLPVAAAACAVAPASAAPDPNPCAGPEAASLRCPDLVMRRPFGLYVDVKTHPSRVLLRAGNSVDNKGTGPAELFGTRTSRSFMRAHQRIYRRGGGRIAVRTGARLQFKLAHLHRRWWKFLHAAEFQLWRLDRQGKRTRLVRRGPKVSYCLRDLGHTRPGLRGSPRRRVYPACSTNRFARKDTLGTSVGWSDIYPPSYPEQWIDVTGLRGCFAYMQRADPRNGIYESNESNNTAQTVVRLPLRPGHSWRQGCRGPDVGAGPPHDRSGEY